MIEIIKQGSNIKPNELTGKQIWILTFQKKYCISESVWPRKCPSLINNGTDNGNYTFFYR